MGKTNGLGSMGTDNDPLHSIASKQTCDRSGLWRYENLQMARWKLV
jgi:hypothetical protein